MLKGLVEAGRRSIQPLPAEPHEGRNHHNYTLRQNLILLFCFEMNVTETIRLLSPFIEKSINHLLDSRG